jgi:hypothetical protein
MLRQSLIATAVAVATITSAATIGYAQTEAGTYQRPIVRHVNGVWGPIPDYGPLNVPYYASHYGPVAPVAAAADVAAATTCFAFSLIGAC